ncbi:MAG: hypothetical protein AABW46_00035 [Nanoarchaeota archaeon]
MNRESKILIGAVIIIIIAIFSFNSGITSFSVKESSGSIIISPKSVSAGENIIVTVIPGFEGVNNKVSFYNAEDDLRKDSVELCKGSFRCEKESSINYWVSNSWDPGVYYVKVYDYNRKGFIIEDFTIR